MRILILVLSCHESPYHDLFQAQLRTWDSVRVEGVETRYYFCGLEDMLWKLKLEFDQIIHEEWDFVFRTNASSYVDKKLLLEKAKTLPSRACYCGIDGGQFASGSGMFLSQDVVKILQQEIENRTLKKVVEDQVIGWTLLHHGIPVTPGAERYDWYTQEFMKKFYGQPQDNPLRHYHLRCKSDTEDRQKDVQAMETIHQLKMEKVS